MEGDRQMVDKLTGVLDEITVSPELVMMDLEAETDQEALDKMARLLYEKGYVKESYIQAVKDREKEFYTGLNFEELGVAIPHTDAIHVNQQAIEIAILKKPVSFRIMGETEGSMEVRLIFMLAIKKPDKQLDFLSHMMDSCIKEGNLTSLYHSKDANEAVERFKNFFEN